MDTKQQIEALELRLIAAMKTSNVPELDVLLADNLIFTNHNGHLVTKQDDLETHRSGNLEIYSIDTSAQLIEVLNDTTAIVSVVKDLSSDYDGHISVGIFRFTRVWHNSGGQWQVVAAHSSQLVS
ncbi:nuclear transport factor 2 family protein [Flavobacterium psychrotrophum]|uniref:nuclear transport factor 2 family protein n=1 Tax=Flavobacterium psychrotrophum TaxID=2294119 RepID=UPI000E31B2D2|nr:nuclear transport factor 2 family protein [Flavobacterium psychrotrophum]